MVVWIENYPAFDTPEGIEKINQVCSCEMPPKNLELVSYCTEMSNSSTH